MKAVNIGKYIANHCINLNKPVSSLKIQKLLFLSVIEANSKGLKLVDEVPKSDELLGPIYEELNPEFFHFGAWKVNIPRNLDVEIPLKTREIVDDIIKKYIDTDVFKLIDLSKSKVYRN